MKKILMLGNSHLVIFGFRGELIQKLISEGYEVVVSFPNGPFGEGEKTSAEYGCGFVEIPMNRRGTNPIQELFLLMSYRRLVKQIRPDIVLAYTVKCDTYGGIACRMLGIPYILNITGLGKGLAEGGMTQKITTLLYKISARSAECVFFQNEQDKKFFDENRILYKTGEILPGSGVNLSKFAPLPYPVEKNVVFTYIARVMKAKGIDQFLDAAKAIKKSHPDTEFWICGYCEEDYKGIIDQAEKEGYVKYYGLVKDIASIESKSHCIVLPTYHPEGISNVLLEAAASARPIITTDRAGCRETVDDGITGLLVKEKDSDDLIAKMERFLSLSVSQRAEMGIKGREKMEQEFDRNIVVKAYTDLIGRI